MRNGYGISALVFAATSALPLTGCGSSGSSDAATTANVCSNITYAAPSGAANNIVFTFDKAYTCGQFANGDWWVAPPTNGGSITITSITPAAGGGVNGFMVNPDPTAAQAYDSRSNMSYNSALMPALPLTINTTTVPISSIVKSVSVVTPSPLVKLQFAAVLTVINATADKTAYFRPGYFGTTKTSYAVPSSGTVAGLPLGTYTPTGVPDSSTFTIANVVTIYQHLQLDLNGGWAARDLHPIDNMPDYGASIATNTGTSLLRMLLSDFNYSNPASKQALVNYLQMAIDLKEAASNGAAWPADGGHGTGRKLPLQFANMVLGGTDFSNAIAASTFAEDQQVYRSSVTGEVLWGRVTDGTEYAYWNITKTGNGAKDVRDYYGRIDGGGTTMFQQGYQFCCTSKPFKYEVLALYMLGLQTPPTSLPLPGTLPLVEYVERWVNYGVKTADTYTNINLATHAVTHTAHGLTIPARPAYPVTAVYGTDYGPNGSGGYIVGTNNWTSYDGLYKNGGYYGNTFGDQLWAWYRP